MVDGDVLSAQNLCYRPEKFNYAFQSKIRDTDGQPSRKDLPVAPLQLDPFLVILGTAQHHCSHQLQLANGKSVFKER